METLITVQFQSSVAGERPSDEALNREEMVTSNLGNIPLVGDYVCFDNENELEVVYKVKSRLFDYKYSDKKDKWTIFANVVVEKQSDEMYNNLIKH